MLKVRKHGAHNLKFTYENVSDEKQVPIRLGISNENFNTVP